MIDFIRRPMSNSTIVIEVSGRFTDLDREKFFGCVSGIIDSGYKNVIIECHKLGYLSSGGLASLLNARKRAGNSGGRIFLTHLNSQLAAVLEVTKLGRILSVFPSTADAITNIETQLACVG